MSSCHAALSCCSSGGLRLLLLGLGGDDGSSFFTPFPSASRADRGFMARLPVPSAESSWKDRCFFRHNNGDTVCWNGLSHLLSWKSRGAQADELACVSHTSDRASSDAASESADTNSETGNAHESVNSESCQSCSTCSFIPSVDGRVNVELGSRGEEDSIREDANATEVEGLNDFLPLPLEPTEVESLNEMPLSQPLLLESAEAEGLSEMLPLPLESTEVESLNEMPPSQPLPLESAEAEGLNEWLPLLLESTEVEGLNEKLPPQPLPPLESAEAEGLNELLPLQPVPLESTEVEVLPTQPLRLACPKGSRCRNRDMSHTATHAHPLDLDYVACCQATGLEPQPLSLKTVFDWIDASGSGRLTREELEANMGTIRDMFDDWLPELTDEEWGELDEDGNGVANFGEFVCWAGPRLGLPLGMENMRHSTQSLQTLCSPCSVHGCSCGEFVPMRVWPRSKCATCGHKQQFHKLQTRGEEEVPFPPYWIHREGVFNMLVRLNKTEVSQFQRLVDITYSNKYTRDRRRHNPQAPNVPRRYCVKQVFRNENCLNWREYGCRRAELLTRLQEEEEVRLQGPRRLLHAKSTAAWKEIAGVKGNDIEEQCNEWYVFHGTSPEVAQLICATDFKVRTAGSNTGTLYGRGLYFAESITKADEYAQADKHGHCAVLLCRVLGGRVLYTDEVAPDSDMLANACIEGPYDCVLGDREQCRGTYREFVFFDSEDVYPEYVI
eukprot:CAMPEP_0172940912 /NCGR_PEP_ID=MMETSP1075-20121228/224278_1 /TAXON_ID=2916 /ORGANISM="Ceratium fusus, Strain PA161109" /LENGTH=725 /DNA_ID=CAMNT_0013802321 /DNA_START=22 /DNA_END=2196 /DNA_ORIENTATION=+